MIALLLLLAQPLGLRQAQERARARNPELLAARQVVRVGEAGVEAAGQLANPTLSASFGPDEPTVSGAIDVKAPIFGQRGTAIAAAEREVDVRRAEEQARLVKLLAAVRRAYFGLAAAQARAQLSEAALELALELEKRIEAKVASGGAAELELLQARVSRMRFSQERDDRTAALAGAREELAQLVGDAEPSELQASDPLLPVPEPPALAKLLESVDKHPELLLLHRERDAALARADQERAAVRPLPDLSLAVEKLSGSPSIGLRAGIAFDLPLLSWNRGRVGQAQAEAELANVQAQGASQRLRSELRAAWAKWQASSQRAKSYAGEIVPAAERLLQMARDAYELGRAPLLAVLQAQTELNASRAQAADAAADAQRGFADLEEAAGESL